MKMVEHLVAGQAGFKVDDREIRRGGPSYTADTLEEIHSERPDVDLYLIVGQDSAATMSATWHRPNVIFDLATVVVVTRPQAALPKSVLPSDSIYVEMNPVDVSSSQIRNLASRGESFAHLTSDSVAQFIVTHDVYRGLL
jgi:nicotinate-nucleotide adenylyltransferase